MKKFLTIMLLLVSRALPGADQPDDGIYLRAQGEPAPQIKSQDRQKLFLGKRQELKILKSELISVNNANDSFHLQLTIPYDENLGSGSYILIVDGTAYRQSSSGANQKETSTLSFYISGD